MSRPDPSFTVHDRPAGAVNGNGQSQTESDVQRSAAGAKPVPNLNSAVHILENDPAYRGNLWFDEFLQRPMTGNPTREWHDSDDLNLTLHIQRTCLIARLGREIASQAAMTVAFRHRRNCVRDWLESLEWDQECRIEGFFEMYFGAAINSYTRAAARNFWLSMVARIYQPGCQCDNMVVLEGPQGIGKSASLRIIGGAWFAEQHESAANPKAFAEILQGKLLVEISEMDAFSRADITRVKQVVTCISDRFREPYAKRPADHPRQCVFVGTTNKDDWNRDETGARRFWPIACVGNINLEAVVSNREQFFAEAVVRFKAGEQWWQMPTVETRNEQASRYVAPAWVDPVRRYIEHERLSADNWVPRPAPLAEVSISEILDHALDVPRAQWTKANEMRVAESLRFLGWTKRDVRREGRVVKRWLLPLNAATHEEVAT